MNEENVKQYREEVIKYLTDPDSPGEIDFLERQMLTRTKKRLGISDILAKDIEDKLILQYAAKVENNCELILANDTEKKIESYELREQLKNDLKRLGTQAKYDSIEIVSIFNEGKTGAFVFQAKVRKNKEESLYVYKYDYFPKILKEYIGFEKKKQLQGQILPAHYDFMQGSPEYHSGFLQMPPAQNFAGGSILRSLKQLLTENILEFDMGTNQRKKLSYPIGQVVHFLVTKFYYPYQKIENLSYQNSFEQFLPPREDHNGKIVFENETIDTTIYYKVRSLDIVSYDLYPKTKEVSGVKFKMLIPSNGFFYRRDANAEINYNDTDKLVYNLKSWNLYIEKKPKNIPERQQFLSDISKKYSFLSEVSKKFNLSNIFSKASGEFHLNDILQTKGTVFNTSCLHGDLNTANILLCKLSNGHFSPLLIDFYETGITGNMFFDLARLEAEMAIPLLSFELRDRFNLKSDTNALADMHINFILNFEEQLFQLRQDEKAFNGDFVLFDFRKSLSTAVKDVFSETDYAEFEWFKNYILAIGIYTIKYSKFKETNLNKLVATVWGMRFFHRFENFKSNEARKVFDPTISAMVSAILTNKFHRLKQRCTEQNKETKKLLGIEQVPINLHVDFHGELRSYFQLFLEQNKYNSFFLMGDSGTGKTVFLDYYTMAQEFSFPILFLAGNKECETEDSFIKEIKLKLGAEFDRPDWLSLLDHTLDDGPDKYRYLVVIIENTYYNPDPTLFIKSFLRLIQEIKGGKVKLVVPCTQSFWDENIEFTEATQKIISMNAYPHMGASGNSASYYQLTPPNDSKTSELLNKYFKEYKIHGNLIGKAEALAKNPWILSLFCETKKNTHIGNLDHVFFVDIIEKFIEKKNKKVAAFARLPEAAVYKFMLAIAKEMESKNAFLIQKDIFYKMFQEHFPKDVNFDTFKNSLFQTGYMSGDSNKFQFRHLEIPAYLIVSDRIKTFSDEGTLEQSFDVWLIPAIKKIKKVPFYEILVYYFITLLFKKFPGNMDYFHRGIEKLIQSFTPEAKSLLYALGRIFARAICTLPKVDSKTARLIIKFQMLFESTKRKYNDRVLEKAYNTCFVLIEDNFVYDKDAIIWTEKFEKFIQTRDTVEIIKTLKSSDTKWDELLHFLKNDYKKNSNFIRNYLTPVLDILKEKLHDNEIPLIKLSEDLLNLNKKSQYKYANFENKIYDILFEIERTHREQANPQYRNKALEVIALRKIYDKETFRIVLDQLYKCSNAEDEFAHLLRFLINYSDFESEIDFTAYETLKKLLKDIKYEKLSHNMRKLLDDYLLKHSPQLMYPLVKAMKLGPIDQKKFLMIAKNSENGDKDIQPVLYIIIKNQDEFLLKYNKQWKDYNWVGEQLKHDPGDDKEVLIKKAKEIVEKKLRLEAGSYDIHHLTTIKVPYERYSRSRKKYVQYIRHLTYLTIKQPYVFSELLKLEDLKPFKWDYILEPINIEISGPVKDLVDIFSAPNVIQKWKDTIKDVWVRPV